MARKFKFCANCRRTITESALRRGLYVETADGLLCATCAQRLDEAPPTGAASASKSAPAKRPAPSAGRGTVTPQEPAPLSAQPAERSAGQLNSILQHVEAIRRLLLFEKSSTWNVVGATVQCLAVGMLVIAVFKWLENPLNLLIVALILQVMALTLFLKGK